MNRLLPTPRLTLGRRTGCRLLAGAHQLTELYELLSHNYVEDEDAMFRFDYSAEFLRWCVRAAGRPQLAREQRGWADTGIRDQRCVWPTLRALQPPGWLKSWHPGVRVTASRKLVAFISAIPADLRIYKQCVAGRA